MKKAFEMSFYVAVSAGMAMATSSFLIIAGAFESLPAGFVMAAIVAAMFCCMLISSPIAEMASMFPSSPGVRTYVQHAYGDRISLFVVFVYLAFVIVAAGAESYMFAYVVQRVIPGASMWLCALGLIAVITFVNWLGVVPSRGVQIAATGMLSMGVALLGLAGLAAGDAASVFVAGGAVPVGAASGVETNWQHLMSLPAVAGICMFLFIGFEWVTPLGFGPSAYARRIPWAMPCGIALNGVLYLLFVLGAASVLTGAEVASTPAPQLPVAVAVMGAPGLYAILLLCALATASTFNAGVMGGARLVYALARERRLPSWCAHFDVERGAPRGAIALLAVLASVATVLTLLLDAQLAAAVLASTLVCTVYGALLLSARKLRMAQPKRRRAFRSRFGVRAMMLLAISLFGLGASAIAAEPDLAPQVGLSAVACYGLAMLLALRSARAQP